MTKKRIVRNQTRGSNERKCLCVLMLKIIGYRSHSHVSHILTLCVFIFSSSYVTENRPASFCWTKQSFTSMRLASRTRYIPRIVPGSAHTVVTLITTSRLAALIRGSLGRSWLRMCKMVYPQWWFRIVLNLRLCRLPPLLARP